MRDAIRKGVVQGVVAGLIRSLGIWGLIIAYALSFAAAAASKIGGLPLWLAFLVFLLGGTVLVIAFLLMAIALARLGIIARELFSTPSKRNLPVVAFQSEQATAGQRSTTTFSDETRRFYDGIREFALVSLSDASDKLLDIFGAMRNIDMGASGNAASLIWEAIENGLLAKRRIVHDAPPPQSDQDAETFCEAVVAFFRSYAKTQGYLPDFVQTTNIDPERLGLVSRWLEADKECLRALKRLQIQFPNRTAQLAESLTATARGLNTASLSALVTKSALPPVSERDRQLAEQERPESEVRLEITNVLFDPNGLTEMYIVFDLRNPSTPTTVKNWRLAVRDSDKMILAEQAPRVVHTRTRFRGPREIHETENLAETPLEQGGERHGCRLVYSFLRNVAVDLFDKPGARFKVTAEDVHGNQIAASFTRGS